jgi:hypothetical protein
MALATQVRYSSKWFSARIWASRSSSGPKPYTSDLNYHPPSLLSAGHELLAISTSDSATSR